MNIIYKSCSSGDANRHIPLHEFSNLILPLHAQIHLNKPDTCNVQKHASKFIIDVAFIANFCKKSSFHRSFVAAIYRGELL